MVTFHIPGALREFTGSRSNVEIEASLLTVADALLELWRLYPGARDRIATEQGQIREHINLFVGEEDIRYTGGLMTRISYFHRPGYQWGLRAFFLLRSEMCSRLSVAPPELDFFQHADLALPCWAILIPALRAWSGAVLCSVGSGCSCRQVRLYVSME
jgi:molybdopterin synthase sulfur carrier subunit